MNESQEQSGIARRHSWQPIQDGAHASITDSKGCNKDYNGILDDIKSATEQGEVAGSTQAQVGKWNIKDLDDQPPVLQNSQPPTVVSSNVPNHALRPNQTIPQEHQITVQEGLLFANDQDAAHIYRRRVTEPPKLAPSQDRTIIEVKTNREQHIAKMIAAVYDLSNVLDKANGRECKMFARDPALTEYVEPLTVEAACRAVFDILIDRCQHGFRGQEKDNHARKPAIDRETDRDGSCSTRLSNILKVLRTSKCACRDILNEDYKITLLVNHPLYFLKKKNECRRNNEHKRNVNIKAKAALAAAEGQEGSPKELTAVYDEMKGPAGPKTDLAVRLPHRHIRNQNDALETNRPNDRSPVPPFQQIQTQSRQDQNYQMEYGSSDIMFGHQLQDVHNWLRQTTRNFNVNSSSLATRSLQQGRLDWRSHGGMNSFQQSTDHGAWDDGNSPPPDFFPISVSTEQHQERTWEKHDPAVIESSIDPALEGSSLDNITTSRKRRSSSAAIDAERPSKVLKV